MDPTQLAQLMSQGNNAGQQPAAPSPQQMLTIQNLMKGNPGGMGAMQPPPNSLMQPPPGPPNPQQSAAQGQAMAPPPGLQQLGQNAQQLLGQYNQPVPQPNIPVGP